MNSINIFGNLNKTNIKKYQKLINNIDSSKFLAKPNNINLEDHNQHVLKEAYYYLDSNPFIVKKLKHELSKYNLNIYSLIEKIVKLHDEGKKLTEWQTPCKLDKQIFDDNNRRGNKYNHNFHHIKEADFRHELGSVCMRFFYDDIKRMPFEDELIIWSILCHHGKFKKEYEAKIYNIDNNRSYSWDIKNSNISKDLFYYYSRMSNRIKNHKDVFIFNAVRSILQIADKRASYLESYYGNIKKDKEDKIKISNFGYSFNHINKTTIQDILSTCEEYDLTIAKAYTGGGKTDGSLIWAKRMIDMGYGDRVIFAMPTILTSNSIKKSIENASVHNSISKTLDNKSTYYELMEIKTFQKPITVTTIDYLLASIIGRSEINFISTYNIANSVIIIDEVDFYDSFVLSNLKEFLKITSQYNIKILLMSATFPASFRNFFTDLNYSVSPILEDKSNKNKDKVNLKKITSYNSKTLKGGEKILQKALKKKTIIYANTVIRAKTIYDYLNEIIEERGLNKNILLYNSQFIQNDKTDKERRIINNFGKEQIDGDYDIVIMTQIGEMSINITCEYMISDICPIDRLTQRLGRLGRFDGKVYDLDILVPVYESGKLSILPYKHPEMYIQKSLKILKENTTYTYGDLDSMVNKIYKKGVIVNIKSKDNSDKYKELIEENKLFNKTMLNPDTTNDEEVSSDWQTRDFMSTTYLYIYDFDLNRDYKKEEFSKIQIDKTIRLNSNYMVNSKNGSLNPNVMRVDLMVGGKKMDNIFILLNKDKNYSYDSGLSFNFYNFEQDIDEQIV